ncbi:MAG: GNAT family N-acetyltransferase [Alphaproteobacteria bacterium]
MNIIPATEGTRWHALLDHFDAVDCTFLPEYHLAYALRIKDSTPLLWYFEQGGQHLIYPFLLTPVEVAGEHTGHHDISSIYGYTGPLATTQDAAFLTTAWQAFDAYTKSQCVIAEFIRFSPFNENHVMAHPACTVEENRQLAVSRLPDTEEELLQRLGSKTRNMLRKAEKSGLAARELPLPEKLSDFRLLYDETMGRNQAPDFFWYDDEYWNELLKLEGGLRLFGTYKDDVLVAASMSVVHGRSALYHLGASLVEFARQGAGNLSMYEMSKALMQSGVTFINMTGGRTTALDDPLLLFKKSNATGLHPFYIGKRVMDNAAYREVAALWQQKTGTPPNANKIIFWR